MMMMEFFITLVLFIFYILCCNIFAIHIEDSKYPAWKEFYYSLAGGFLIFLILSSIFLFFYKIAKIII